jgi:hypothetical protein
MREFATYQEIQKWVQREFGFKPKTCSNACEPEESLRGRESERTVS